MREKEKKAVEKLMEILEREKISADIIWHEEFGRESKEAAVFVKVTPDRILKTLTFIRDDGKPVLVVITGDRKVDEKKLANFLGSKARLAKASEVREVTGYEVGGVPPFGADIETVFDLEVLKKDVVLAPAGSPFAGMKIKPEDMLKLKKEAKKSDISAV